MNKNILIIVNPNAGRGKVQKKIHMIAKNLSKQNYLVDIIYTKINYSAASIIRDYKGKLDLGCHRNKDIFIEVDSEQYDSDNINKAKTDVLNYW